MLLNNKSVKLLRVFLQTAIVEIIHCYFSSSYCVATTGVRAMCINQHAQLQSKQHPAFQYLE